MPPISQKPRLEQVDPPRSPRETLPTMYDLPSENPEESGLPDEFHDLQPQLLSRTLRLTDYPYDYYFTASDLNLYYDVNHPLWCKRPDWFLSIHVPRLYEGKELRRSYVVWQEGKSPYVAIEFLSPGTEAEDLGRFVNEESPQAVEETSTVVPSGLEYWAEAGPTAKPPGKLAVYEQYLRIPHYLVYSRYTQRLRYFKLHGGRYQEQQTTSEPPSVWLADLAIGLGIWQGTFEGVPGYWLRWCDRDGQWLLTDTEQEQAAREQAEQMVAQERAAREQAEQMAAQERVAREDAQTQILQAARNLLATGMVLEQVAQLLGLTVAQIQALQSSD